MNTKKKDRKISPRIIAGKYKGLKLNVPESARPFTDRVKISVFGTLGETILEAKVLDLFAGSGNLSIEAVSRGAASADMVEIDKKAVEIIKQNTLLISNEDINVFQANYEDFIKASSKKYDLIFVDPPFKIVGIINLRLIGKLMNKDTIMVLKIERLQQHVLTIPEEFVVIYEKDFGINKILYLKLRY